MRQVYSSANRMSIAAHCARVAVPLGTKVEPVTPVMMPFSTAQDIAVDAQSLTLALSVNFARL